MNRNCTICGKTFIPHVHNQLYCSDKCRKEAKRRQFHKYKRQDPQRFKEYNQIKIWKRKAKRCCKRHGGIDHCPFDDCICE